MVRLSRSSAKVTNSGNLQVDSDSQLTDTARKSPVTRALSDPGLRASTVSTSETNVKRTSSGGEAPGPLSLAKVAKVKEKAHDKAQHLKEAAHVKAEHLKEQAHSKAEHVKEKAHEKAAHLKEKAEHIKEQAIKRASVALDVVGLSDKWRGLHVCGLWFDTSCGQLAIKSLQGKGCTVIAVPDRHNRSLLAIIFVGQAKSQSNGPRCEHNHVEGWEHLQLEASLTAPESQSNGNCCGDHRVEASSTASATSSVRREPSTDVLAAAPSPVNSPAFGATMTELVQVSGARALMDFQDHVVKCFKPVVSWYDSESGKRCEVTKIHPDVIWPLHDEAINDRILKDIVHRRRIQDILFHTSKLRDVSCLQNINRHFGSDVAYEFLYMSHYIRCLSVLAMFAIPVLIFRAATEARMYDYVRPFLGFITVGWAVCVRYLWIPQENEIADSWKADVQDEPEMTLFTFKPWNVAKDPHYYPNWMRIPRTFIMMPAILIELLLIAFVFVCVFWFEMWVIFEWGQCARINKENGNNLCRSPVGIHGFWGGVVEATPSIVEGILFEALLGITKLIAGWVVYFQNWRTLSEQQFAEVTIVFCIEAIGKIGFIANLAFSFVPEWHDGTYDCSQSWDYFIFGDKALSCLKQQVPYEVRRDMLERAMKGPFFVSQLVGMLVKCIIPFLVRLFSAVAMKTKDYTSLCGRCIGKIARHVLRILEVIFYADCDVVGGIPYVWRGMLWKPPTQRKSHGITDSRAPPESPEELKAIKAIEEGKRREFCVFDEFLEMLLQFLWTTSFTAVAPIFAVLAVTNYLIEMRTDAVKLTYVKRRPFPKPAFQTLRWLRRSLRIATVMAMAVNISVLCYSYDSGDLLFPDWRTKGAGSNVESVTALAVASMFVWAVLLLVVLPCVLRHFLHERSHRSCASPLREHASDEPELPSPFPAPPHSPLPLPPSSSSPMNDSDKDPRQSSKDSSDLVPVPQHDPIPLPCSPALPPCSASASPVNSTDKELLNDSLILNPIPMPPSAPSSPVHDEERSSKDISQSGLSSPPFCHHTSQETLS